MQSDDLIWSVINRQFCSYKVKTKTQNFCRNEYNVTGLCNRQSCPLANSRYATVREKDGVVYLFVKTIERAHTPKHMWEKIKLANNYTDALQQIDKELVYWPNFLIHKCKQRLTKITQYLIKLRRMKLRQQTKLVGVMKKLERREATRERKALSAAHIERSIEKELIERLKSRAYGDAPLNVNEDVWQAVLDKALRKDKEQHAESGLEDLLEDEMEEEEELEEDVGEEGWNDDREFVSDLSGGESEDILSDLEGDESEGGLEDGEGSEGESIPRGKRKASAMQGSKATAKSRKNFKRVPHVEIEYEQEYVRTAKDFVTY